MELAELVAALSPSEAQALVQMQRVEDWCEAHGLAWSMAIQSAVFMRSLEPEACPPPPPPDPRRRDTTELQEYVAKAAKLPSRVRAVATLCLDRGLTLEQCATQLGIKRETVRVHLRRLRAMRNAAERRRGQIIAR